MSESTSRTEQKHTAGAFDVRTFIAALTGIFGVIILLAGIVGGDTTQDSKAGGTTVNIWVGIGLLIFAAIMQGWAMLRPTVVDEAQLAREKEDGSPSGH